MKPYGKFIRIWSERWCDKVDVQYAGAQSHVGCIVGPGGQTRGSIKSKNRQTTRRVQKKRTRQEVRQNLMKGKYE